MDWKTGLNKAARFVAYEPRVKKVWSLGGTSLYQLYTAEKRIRAIAQNLI